MAYSAEYKRTTKGRAYTLLSNARARSKAKGIEVQITVEWIEEHLKRGTCELTGLPFSFEPPPKGFTRRHDAPSIDRIDKTKQYTPENSRVILWGVNCALSEYGTDIMLPILERMVNAIKKQSSPVPTECTGESKTNFQLGALHGAGPGEDCDGAHHHRGEPEGQDTGCGTEAGCRICMGSGVRQVEALELYENCENYGISKTEIRGLKELFRCVCH